MSKEFLSGNGSHSESFVHFIGKKDNRLPLLIVSAASIIQFCVFKYFYPFPDFSTDSYSYLYAAYAHLNINVWPIGYSKFLNIFHWLTHSNTALISFQYFFFVLSALCFFFTLNFFYRPGKNIKLILLLFLFFNPLFIYMSNYIGSDTIFLALSLLWFSEIIWIINKPNLRHVFVQAILLFFCFTMRNNAYYYPVIATLVILLIRQKPLFKLAGIAMSLILIGSFILYTRNEAFKLTGIKQFSLFTGWQLANNALYIYEKINVDSNRLPSAECKELERINIRFFRHSDSWPKYKNELDGNEGNFFIQYINSPLKKYQRIHYPGTEETAQVKSWGKVSPVFADYGMSVIKQHPLTFARYYLLLNAKNYFLPPLEKLAIYNRGLDEIRPIAQDWFDFKTPDVPVASAEVQEKILFIFSPLFLLLNVYAIGALTWFFIKKEYLKGSFGFNMLVLTTSSLLFVNFCFSVFATINVLRYQLFPMIICVVCALMLYELIDERQKLQIKNNIKRENKLSDELISKPYKLLQ